MRYVEPAAARYLFTKPDVSSRARPRDSKGFDCLLAHVLRRVISSGDPTTLPVVVFLSPDDFIRARAMREAIQE